MLRVVTSVANFSRYMSLSIYQNFAKSLNWTKSTDVQELKKEKKNEYARINKSLKLPLHDLEKCCSVFVRYAIKSPLYLGRKSLN